MTLNTLRMLSAGRLRKNFRRHKALFAMNGRVCARREGTCRAGNKKAAVKLPHSCPESTVAEEVRPVKSYFLRKEIKEVKLGWAMIPLVRALMTIGDTRAGWSDCRGMSLAKAPAKERIARSVSMDAVKRMEA